MGNRLSSSTIYGMSSSISRTARGATSYLSKQSSSAATLSRSINIGGSYANAFTGYVRSGINGALKATSGLTDQMNRTAGKISRACSQFERSASGVVDEAAINALSARLSSMSQDVSGLQREIDSALNAARKYVPVKPVKLSSVASGYSRVISGLKRIVGDMHRLNSTINGYANGFWGGISGVSGLLNKVWNSYSPGKGFNPGSLADYISNNPTLKNLVNGGKKAVSDWNKWAGKEWKKLQKAVNVKFDKNGIHVKVGGSSLNINTKNLSESKIKIKYGNNTLNVDKNNIKFSTGAGTLDVNRDGITIKSGKAGLNVGKDGVKVNYGDANVHISRDGDITGDTGNVHLYTTRDALKAMGINPDDKNVSKWIDSNNNVSASASGSTKDKTFSASSTVRSSSGESLQQTYKYDGNAKNGTSVYVKDTSISGHKSGNSKYPYGYWDVGGTGGVSVNKNTFEYKYSGKIGEEKHGPYDIFNGKPYSVPGIVGSIKSKSSGGGAF